MASLCTYKLSSILGDGNREDSVRCALAIASDNEETHNRLTFSRAWWIMQLTGDNNNSKRMTKQHICNNSCGVDCLKFKMLWGQTTGYLTCPLLEGRMQLWSAAYVVDRNKNHLGLVKSFKSAEFSLGYSKRQDGGYSVYYSNRIIVRSSGGALPWPWRAKVRFLVFLSSLKVNEWNWRGVMSCRPYAYLLQCSKQFWKWIVHQDKIASRI